MTAPAGGTNPGAVDATPTVGGNQPYAASGAAGDGHVEAPDNPYGGAVHRPGQAPTVSFLDGPAVMKVGARGGSGQRETDTAGSPTTASSAKPAAAQRGSGDTPAK